MSHFSVGSCSPPEIPSSEMNVDLLVSVRRTIARTPDRFCAAQWAFARNADRVLEEAVPPDGFRCCIAGHVLLEGSALTERDLLREGGFHTGGALWEQAATLLDVEEDRGRELFFPSQWDHPFKKRYYLCAQDEEAEVATAYLDYVLQKYESADISRPVSPSAAPVDADRPPRMPTADDRESMPAAVHS